MKRAAVLLLGALMLVPGMAWAAPDDPFYPVQWALSRIQAARAWSVNEGAGIVVAVVDTGVDRNHPDLKGRVLQGYDYVDDDANAADGNGHGTMVAGIIAAITGNGEGIASVAPRSRILPVRVLDDDGTGSSSDVARGIRYAMDRGAHVINLSLAQDGAPSSGLLGSDLLRDPSVGDAIEDAARAGHVVVVAAGNDRQGGESRTAYDATVAGSVVVGASTPDDRRAAYSNHGDGLDLLAPGGGSSSDPRLAGCTQNNSVVSTWWDPDDRRSKYGGGCGTSMAVAFVSGVAAMLRAQGRSSSQAVARILATADDIGASGDDAQTGAGRLNAARALGAPPKRVKPRAAASSDPTRNVDAVKNVVRAQSETRSDGVDQRTPSAEPSPSSEASASRGPDLDARTRRDLAIIGPSVAGSDVPARERKGWPVTLASMLVSLLVMAHAVRFTRAARP